MTEPIPCIEVVELVSDYLEGELDAETAGRVEQHLTLCPPCLNYVDQVRRTVKLTGALPQDGLDPEAVTELEAAFAGFRRPD
jgi:predicted anti-sigma-YlaC factor YlaD